MRWISLLSIVFVVLTACGQEPTPVLMDRSLLTAEEFAGQLAGIREGITGEILDDHQWRMGEERVYTVLSKEYDAEGYRGLYLRHYRVGDPGVELRWTYRDTIKCVTAGARINRDASPNLQPGGFTEHGQEEFLLRYQLGCGPETTDILAVIDARSGTPNVRIEGNGEEVIGADGLTKLPEDTVAQLLAYWQR